MPTTAVPAMGDTATVRNVRPGDVVIEARTGATATVVSVGDAGATVQVEGEARAWSYDHVGLAHFRLPAAPEAPAVDAIEELSERLLVEFARTYHEALGVADAYESDDERLFSVLVEAAKVYVTRGAGGPGRDLADGVALRTNIDCTADALVENLDVVFAEELAR